MTNVWLFIFFILIIVIIALTISYCTKYTNTAIIGGAAMIDCFTNNERLDVFLDERNFYYSTFNIKNAYQKLKQKLAAQYPKCNIQMHIVTKNTNGVDYEDELDNYYNILSSRGGNGASDNDYIHVAATTYDINLKNPQMYHYVKERDDLLLLILASEYKQTGNVLIISNDNFKDIDDMYKMPEFNAITLLGHSIIERRHINPSSKKYDIHIYRQLTNSPNKISIPRL